MLNWELTCQGSTEAELAYLSLILKSIKLGNNYIATQYVFNHYDPSMWPWLDKNYDNLYQASDGWFGKSKHLKSN